MNTIANTAVSKLFVAFVAVAMLFTLVAPSAKAATMEELQAQIAALMAQISAMSGTSSSAACTFTRSLTIGSEGADVKCLQTSLTPTYFNHAGGATGYFGPVTASAVASWQAANGVSPAVGYFGPISQAKYAATMGSTPSTPSTPGTDTSGGDMSLGGEASLDTVEINDADDSDVEEGDEEVEIAEIDVEFSDGDALITRLDLALELSGGEAWDTFDTISLWVDGKEVATENADDEDDYLDEDDGSLRFSNLDIVAMEDEEVTITVKASIQTNLDDADLGDWEVFVLAMRYEDADEVTTTDDSTGDLIGNTTAPFTSDPSASFTIEEEGGEDELIVKTSSADPDGTTLQLEDDSKSDWYNVFTFDLDTDDSTNDIELNRVVVHLAFSSSTYASLVDDAELVIDGVTIDDVTASTSATATDLTFDVDGDVTIDAGDRVAAELMLRFKSLALGNEGVTVTASLTAANRALIQAEGADDLATSQMSGAATGDAHTLRTAGVNVEAGDMEATVTPGDNNLDDYGTFSIEVEVTAFEQDVYISTNPATSLTYVLEDSTGSTSVSGTRSAVLTSTADEEGSTFEVTEGSTETFTLTVTYTPGVANTASRLNLNSIIFGSSSGTPTGQSWTASPDEDYRTAVKTMVN